MAITKNYYTGDGSETAFTFSFPYLNTSHIKVKLDKVLRSTTEYTLTPTSNPTTVTFNTAPTNLQQIEIYRETDVSTANNVYAAGSSVKAGSLNDNQTQVLYALEERVNAMEAGEIYNYANANITTGASVPTSPSSGDLWYNSTNGRLYFFYTDVDTSQWVEASPPVNTNNITFTSGTELTITAGVITATASFHTVAVESGTTDDLTTINGGVAGQLLTIKAADDGKDIVATDGSNLKLAGNFTLNNAEDTLTLISNGTNWAEVSRSNNGS